MKTVLSLSRIVGAIAIGAAGVFHVLGKPEVANALMVLGAGAAAPGGNNE